MKNLLFLAAFLAAFLSGAMPLQAQSATNEVEMQDFDRQFMTAYNQQDHAALGKMYTDDAVRIDQKGKEIKSAKNIAAYFADQFRLNNATVFVRHLGINWSDSEHAWIAKGSYEGHGITNVYDIKVDFSGSYANTMIKDNGKWKIARSIHSPLEHADPTVAANIKMYTEVWDGIVNRRQLELFNATHFTEDVIMHAEPENIVGIEAMKAYYKTFLTGFSDIEFTINNVFGEGNQLVKHWTFKGTHTGDFFGIPATGNKVSLDGNTLVRMSAYGRIAEEQDFIDNMAMLSQLGVVSAPGNVAVVDQLYKAFAKGDMPTALATMDVNIVWNEAESFPYSDQNPYLGPDAVLNGVFARVGGEWEYFNLTDIQLHEMSGNMVLATLRYKAKHKKTGKVMDSQTAHLYTLKNGKIVSFQQYTDTKKAAETISGDLTFIPAENFYLPFSTTSATAIAACRKAEQLASNINFEEANIQLDKALEADPNFFMAYVLKIYYDSGDKRAPGLIGKALAIDPSHFNEAEKILRQQLVVWDKDPKANVSEYMKRLVAAYPQTPQAYQWASLHAAYTDKDTDAALTYAKKLAELSPDFAPNYNNLGYLYMGKEQMKKAKAAFSTYIALLPNEANPYDSMADYYMNNKEYAKSAEYYDKAAAKGMTTAKERAEKARKMMSK